MYCNARDKDGSNCRNPRERCQHHGNFSYNSRSNSRPTELFPELKLSSSFDPEPPSPKPERARVVPAPDAADKVFHHFGWLAIVGLLIASLAGVTDRLPAGSGDFGVALVAVSIFVPFIVTIMCWSRCHSINLSAPGRCGNPKKWFGARCHHHSAGGLNASDWVGLLSLVIGIAMISWWALLI